MWIVMVSMVSGCLMYTVLVANATAMIATIDPAAKEYKSKVLMGESELHKIKLTLAKLVSCGNVTCTSSQGDHFIFKSHFKSVPIICTQLQ